LHLRKQTGQELTGFESHTCRMTDPRPAFTKAVAIATDTISEVKPDHLNDPTPCDDTSVRQLLSHMADVMSRVAVVGRGGEPMTAPGVDAENIPDDGWTKTWRSLATDADAAWADDAALTRTVTLPWAVQAGAQSLAMWTNEITVHTWDLATAIGQQPKWDHATLEVAFDAIRRDLPAEGRMALFESLRQSMPPEMRDGPPAFGAAVPVADDAPLIDRLVGWNGRDPKAATS
jgi:uncharacterized protein (TIGR03086 family)